MRLIVHVFRLLFESLWYAVATRRVAVLLVLLIGLAMLAISLTAQTVAPLALYPFA